MEMGSGLGGMWAGLKGSQVSANCCNQEEGTGGMRNALDSSSAALREGIEPENDCHRWKTEAGGRNLAFHSDWLIEAGHVTRNPSQETNS